MLRALPSDAPLPRVVVRQGYLRYVLLQYTHCYIDLSIGFDAYKAKFSGKTRSTIARKIRKFEEHCGGRLEWRTYREPDELLEFHRLARLVSVSTYQERLLGAGIPDSPEFVADMLRRAGHDGVRGWILFDRERPVSYLYCPAHDGVLVYAYLGYSPEYAKHSVGTVLQWLAVEQLYAERTFTYFDFTEGESEHKRLFATHELLCVNLLFARIRARNVVLICLHLGVERLSAALGALAERWGLKSRLRRILRFGFRSSP